MQKRAIFAVASKVLGLYFLVNSLVGFCYLPLLYLPISGGSSSSVADSWFWMYFLSSTGALMASLAASFILIRRADALAARLTGAEADEELSGHWTSEALQEVAFSSAR
jgi:hypothetical protein